MQYQSFSLPPITKGLILVDQPNIIDPSSAIDCMDVDFSQRGAVQTRPGYAKFTSSEGTNRFDSMAPYYTTAGTNQLVCGAGNRLDVLNTSGGVVASSTSPTASPHYFARFGGPNNEVMYIANGTDTVRQWNGSAFSTPSWVTTTIDGKFLSVTPWDNRLVNARLNGTTAGDNPNTVRFSNPGDPLTFAANNYVDLTPGDGEVITGMVTWGQRLFVFKQSKFFVFYGTSTDSAGSPVFNYNAVTSGRGLFTSGAVTKNTDGVYFMDHDGVYRTTGGAPEMISTNIEPFFLGGALDSYTGGQLNASQIGLCRMAAYNDLIMLACPTESSSTNNRILVYDTIDRNWTVYSIAASSLTAWRITALDELVFSYAAGTKDVGRHSASYTTDDGTAISALFKGGWFDSGVPDMKVIRETKMWGKGHVSFGFGYDFQPATQTELVDFSSGGVWGGSTWGGGTWGSSAPTSTLVRDAVKGTVFSMQLQSYDSTPWSLNRVTVEIRGARQKSVTA